VIMRGSRVCAARVLFSAVFAYLARLVTRLNIIIPRERAASPPAILVDVISGY